MRKSRASVNTFVVLVFILLCFNTTTPGFTKGGSQPGSEPIPTLSTRENADNHSIYLPLIENSARSVHRVNVPYFEGRIRGHRTTIFWFGEVNPTDNYSDVRVGYNDDELQIHVSVFDRRLWYDGSPSPIDLNEWDAVSVYLDRDGDIGDVPDTNSYKFIGQLNWWEEREAWQTAYRGDGSGWVEYSVSFTSTSGWSGNLPNDDVDDRGWLMVFRIPFSSLGLSGPPQKSIIWGMALSLHDRDDEIGTPITEKTWPEGLDANSPKTWGQLAFGLPTYTPPSATPGGEVVIRRDLNGAEVKDAHVGGHSICGDDYNPNFFDGWGDANYAGYDQIKIQNQGNLADWPCFSKYYITFPLDTIPPGKVILSSTLHLYQFGNAGEGDDPPPESSLIQVLTVRENWEESTLTWNNAPLATENVSQAWVDPLPEYPGWPGVPRDWDVSIAVAEAYASNEPLRLVLYSADFAQHSGKYFYSSDAGEAGRPTLQVLWGDP